MLCYAVNTLSSWGAAVGIPKWPVPPSPPLLLLQPVAAPFFPGLCRIRRVAGSVTIAGSVTVAGSVTAGAAPRAGGAVSVRRRPRQCHRSLGHFPGRWERRCQLACSLGGCWQRGGSLPLAFGRGSNACGRGARGRITGSKERDWFDAPVPWHPPVSYEASCLLGFYHALPHTLKPIPGPGRLQPDQLLPAGPSCSSFQSPPPVSVSLCLFLAM